MRHPPDERAVFRSRLLPYGLLLPQIAITLVFFYWPASQAVWQSFLVQDAFGLKTEFVWLENYRDLFSQPAYYRSLISTGVFSTAVTALSLSIALLLAVMAGQADPGRSGLPHAADLAVRRGAGGGRRAVDVHVPPVPGRPSPRGCARSGSIGIPFSTARRP